MRDRLSPLPGAPRLRSLKVGIFAFGLQLLRASVGFWCRRAAQQAFGAEVFVEVRPVDAVASTGNLPVFALRGCGIEQPRIPYHRQRARRPRR